MPVSIEIFRTGTHRDMAGREITFTEGDLKATAVAYDPQVHEAPACVGHPKHDAPAYAWASSLKFADGILVAEVDQVDPAFAELVKAGRFKKISAAFYEPDSPVNPKPGQYYLRHIGFLGAQPPAVKGLKQAAFADDEAGVVAFADYDQLDLVSILRGLREWIIEKDGADAADKVLPSWTLDRLQNSAAQPDSESDAGADGSACCAEAAPGPEITAAEKRLAKERAAFEADRVAFAEQRATQRRTEDIRFIDNLVKAGRLLPAQKAGTAAFLEAISGAGTVAFGEGNERREIDPRDWFQSFAAGLPAQVTFGEVAVPQDLQRPDAPAYRAPHGYAVDPARAELHAEALAYQEAHQGVTYLAAVKAVSQE